MRKFFISFTGTIAALVSGKVTLADLDQGLIVFGCSRGHCLHPGAIGESIERVVRDFPDVHRQLVAAVLRAEPEGRVRWRPDVQQDYEWERAVNAVLADHGYPMVLPQPPEHWLAPCFNPFLVNRPYLLADYPEVERRVAAADIGLEVVWRS